MLKQLTLTNFKSYPHATIDLRPLTVMSGLNSAGKSTVIQSLLLLRQSYQYRSDMSKLLVDGEYVDLGSGREILSETAEDYHIGIGLDGAEWQYNVPVSADDESDILDRAGVAKRVEGAEGDIDDRQHSTNVAPELFSADNFEFISAERVSPSLLYPSKTSTQLGAHGEYAYAYLDKYRSQIVPDAVRHSSAKNNTLLEQADAWMNEITPGTSIRVDQIPQTHNVKPRILTSNGADFSPVNSGFGITYALPVILAMLQGANKLILLENPEVHIHPRGQRMLGELIARAVAAGAQVIVETHSDHILNGIRVAVKHHIIDKDQVGLNFVEKKVDYLPGIDRDEPRTQTNQALQSVVDVVRVADDGSLDHWPNGFFDEWDNALMELLEP